MEIAIGLVSFFFWISVHESYLVLLREASIVTTVFEKRNCADNLSLEQVGLGLEDCKTMQISSDSRYYCEM